MSETGEIPGLPRGKTKETRHESLLWVVDNDWGPSQIVTGRFKLEKRIDVGMLPLGSVVCIDTEASGYLLWVRGGQDGRRVYNLGLKAKAGLGRGSTYRIEPGAVAGIELKKKKGRSSFSSPGKISEGSGIVFPYFSFDSSGRRLMPLEGKPDGMTSWGDTIRRISVKYPS